MVLREVLKYIHDRGQIEVGEVSRELDIPIGLVECAIRTLKDLEYLMPVKSLLDKYPCKFCLFKLTCDVRKIDMFKSYIAEKGKKLLNNYLMKYIFASHV